IENMCFEVIRFSRIKLNPAISGKVSLKMREKRIAVKINAARQAAVRSPVVRRAKRSQQRYRIRGAS
ncbi:MAG TPA: hypothetical protein VGH37_10195, partial [Candidatus Acidoferrum sp.]